MAEASDPEAVPGEQAQERFDAADRLGRKLDDWNAEMRHRFDEIFAMMDQITAKLNTLIDQRRRRTEER